MIRLSGIQIRLHPLFVLIMAGSVLTGYFFELLTLFAIVVIHELGHVMAARGFGWNVREVQLLPFGGVAVVDALPSSALEEAAVAAAGPLQNGLMIAVAYACLQGGIGDPGWWHYFIQANGMIALFNLLPIQPLDGGKLLRALLSLRMTYYQAMTVTSLSSTVLSGLLLLYALWHSSTEGLQLNMAAVGIYLLYANWHEFRSIPYHFIRFLMHRERIPAPHDAVEARPIIVKPHVTIYEIVRMFIRGRYHLIYVMNEQGAVSAVVPESRVIQHFFRNNDRRSAVSELFM